jgi:hypothetical protein
LAHLHDPYELLPNSQPSSETLAESFALAQAIACPDRFTIAARGARATRVSHSLLEQLLEAGQRCCVLTATRERANELVERFPNSVRLCENGETRESLPPSVAAATVQSLILGHISKRQSQCEAAIRKIEQQLQEWESVLPIWDRLHVLDRSWRELEVRKTDLQVEAQPLTEPPELDPVLELERAKLQAKLPELKREFDELSPVVSAKRAGNVFSAGFWKATFQKDLCKRAELLESEIRRAELILSSEADHTPMPTVPTPNPDSQFGAMVEEQAKLEAEFRGQCERLRAANVSEPAQMKLSEVQAAQHVWEVQRHELQAARNAALRSLSDLTNEINTDSPAMTRELLKPVMLVVGPRGAVSDSPFASNAFDRMILETAETVTLSEWERLSVLNDRPICIGDFDRTSPFPSAPINGTHHTNGTLPTAYPLAELWHNGHRPAWSREGKQLLAQLRVVTGKLNPEPLADRPEIELRFGTTTTGEYVLAEVLFPPEMSESDAKQFVSGDLAELLLSPIGPADWNELQVSWPWTATLGEGTWIDLDDGIRERVVSSDGVPVTAAVSFDAQNWTRERAEQWLNENTLRTRSARTASLAS